MTEAAFFKRIFFTLFIVSALLSAILTSSTIDDAPCICIENAVRISSCDTFSKYGFEKIKTVFAKLDAEEKPCEINLYGIPYEENSAYYTHLTIVADTSPKTIISPPVNYGYGADIACFDFLGNEREQIFYAASSGGSGGYGYYYVFDICRNEVSTLFDYADFVNEYTAKYADNYVARIYKSGKEVVDFKITVNQTSQKFWDADGRYTGDDYPTVSDLNYVEPTYNYLQKRYRLNLWQKVTLFCQADVAGYLITVKDLSDDLSFSLAIPQNK